MPVVHYFTREPIENHILMKILWAATVVQNKYFDIHPLQSKLLHPMSPSRQKQSLQSSLNEAPLWRTVPLG